MTDRDDDLVGRLIGGRYRVKSRLGAGGMGAVYVAFDTHNGDKEIALKLIKDQLVDSKEAATRFEREAAALSQIQHANIVQFIGAGVDVPEGGGTGVRYLAMELLGGRTLKERITSRGSMPWRDTLPIVRGIVCALEAAHSHGLIHRDLKPDNVMLVDDSSSFTGGPGVKLLDFGVAKHTTLPEGQTMTGTGMIVGTPGFVAPEIVLHGSSDDPRSDFYALGATWFEMLTGAKPFDAATPFALAMRHVSETPPRPTDLRPFDPVPLPVEALLFKLLAKTPVERPPNAKALLVMLDTLAEAGTRGFLDDADTSELPTMTDMQTPQPGLVAQGRNGKATTPSTQVVEFPPVQRHSPTSRVMMAGAVVAIVAALVVVLASQGMIPGGSSSTLLRPPDNEPPAAAQTERPPVDPALTALPVEANPISVPEPVMVAPTPPPTPEGGTPKPHKPRPPKQPDAPVRPDILPL